MRIKYIVPLGATLLGATSLLAQSPVHGLVAHEWGTFTSFQSSDGNLLQWKPLVTSELPKFVYDWHKPGLGRLSVDPRALFWKGDLESLQRMETPVIYFYSDKEQSVDVDVHFPLGFITEWFPQASQIGPSAMTPTVARMNIDTYATAVSSDSMIHWSNVHILPTDTSGESDARLHKDDSGSHYFTARKTDAAMLQLENGEFEKFLFYRGVANFTTPLRVVMKSDDAVDIANTGDKPLVHLFVLNIKGANGAYVYVPELAPGAVKTVLINSPGQAQSLDAMTAKLAGEMASALTKIGLYPREAETMVNTWKDSWFQERGVRVLYVLPRAWTDSTLPMTLNPTPREVVRTMVGRAEVMTPGVERSLAEQLEKIRNGDAQASDDARRILKNLGRFAEPALDRVIANVNPAPAERDRLQALLEPPSKYE